MRRENHVYKGKIRSLKRILTEKLMGKIQINLSNSCKPLQFATYGKERDITIASSDSLLRKRREIGYLKEINEYLDEIGVDSEGHLDVSNFQMPVNLHKELKIDRDLYQEEHESDSEEYIPSDGELLHRRGIHVTTDPGFAYSS